MNQANAAIPDHVNALDIENIYKYYGDFAALRDVGFRVAQGSTVALLGRNHPVGVLLSALLFGMLLRGGIFVDAFTNHVTKDLVDVLQGTVILFLSAEALFRGRFAKHGWFKRSERVRET